jgi:hypothetical protein
MLDGPRRIESRAIPLWFERPLRQTVMRMSPGVELLGVTLPARRRPGIRGERGRVGLDISSHGGRRPIDPSRLNASRPNAIAPPAPPPHNCRQRAAHAQSDHKILNSPRHAPTSRQPKLLKRTRNAESNRSQDPAVGRSFVDSDRDIAAWQSGLVNKLLEKKGDAVHKTPLRSPLTGQHFPRPSVSGRRESTAHDVASNRRPNTEWIESRTVIEATRKVA